jgi:hypothetical protein
MVQAETLCMVVADGVRADTMARAIAAGSVPALARLAAEGGLHTVTTVFPSVTGLAYVPFVAGRHPAPIGVPGIRWFDRTRRHLRGLGASRSYVGWAMRFFDADLDPHVETLFQRAQPAMGAMTMVGRGLDRAQWVGRSLYWQARAARIHFLRGGLRRWLDWDRDVAARVAARVRRERPRFALAAILTPDKVQHAQGQDSPFLAETLRIVDALVDELRHDAEREGRADRLRIWVVSDHGHSPTPHHDELTDVLRELGLRVASHPFTAGANRADAVVMASGNAMAHVYLDARRPERLLQRALEGAWRDVVDALASRASVDLAMIPTAADRCLVRNATGATAEVAWRHGRVDYRPQTGDPLGLGEERLDLDDAAAWDVTAQRTHPDALVQIATIAGAARSGDVILSAQPGWDFRRKYEPVLHASGHGALHRDHMLVPLVVDQPVSGTPRRTVDIGASALAALGITPPTGVEGRVFL